MKKGKIFLIIFVFISYIFSFANYADADKSLYDIKKHTDDPVNSVLIVYTESGNLTYKKGFLNKVSIFSDIVSSHWNIKDTKIIPQYKYTPGLIKKYDAIFVIDEFEREISSILASDLHNFQRKPKLFIGSAINDGKRIGRKGNINVAEYTINYKNISFSTQYLDIPNNAWWFTDPTVETLATLMDIDGDEIPLIQKIGEHSIYAIGIVPFWYETDTYSIPLLDSLHVVLGHHNKKHNKKECYALLRLEDINADTYRIPEEHLLPVHDFLKSHKIPFHIALIDRYVNTQKGVDIRTYESRRFLNALRMVVGDGSATIIQHGYTHQVKSEVSGIGFELWDGLKNAPLKEDTSEYVRSIVMSVRQDMEKAELPIPEIWETPHYALSEMDDNEINKLYQMRYEHIRNAGNLPFMTKINDTIYIPENAGFVFSKGDVERVENNVKQLLAFEDPTISLFWHPWRDINELDEITHFIVDNGCAFVSLYDLVDDSESIAAGAITGKQILKNYRSEHGGTSRFDYVDHIFFALLIAFTLGVLLYLRNRYRIYKYYDTMTLFSLSLNDLKELMNVHKKELPTIGIFVPARNEGYVIENTIRRLDKLDYVKNKYKVFIIVDERELDDDVEVTTKDVTNRVKKELNEKYGIEYIHIIEVPKWYSGEYGNDEKTYEKSTKGRALNYALTIVKKKFSNIDIIGILDADGRLSLDILKEVAYKYIIMGSRVLQGPVFQISNFNDVSVVGKAAGLELALHHITELPINLLKDDKMQFLAGTNYFIDTSTIDCVGAWDQHALVEDAELAMRLYTKEGVVADYLTLHEIEQTPPNFSIYLKQRERWVRGHLDLIRPVVESHILLGEKVEILIKLFFSQFRFIFDISLPFLAVFMLAKGVPYDMPHTVSYIMILFFIFSVLIWDIYGLIYRRVGKYINTPISSWRRMIMSFTFFIFTPLFMFVQIVPRVYALWNYTFQKSETQWYKTERTKEEIIK